MNESKELKVGDRVTYTEKGFIQEYLVVDEKGKNIYKTSLGLSSTVYAKRRGTVTSIVSPKKGVSWTRYTVQWDDVSGYWNDESCDLDKAQIQLIKKEATEEAVEEAVEVKDKTTIKIPKESEMKKTYKISLEEKATKTQLWTTIKCDTREQARRIVKREVGSGYKIIGISKTVIKPLWEE